MVIRTWGWGNGGCWARGKGSTMQGACTLGSTVGYGDSVVFYSIILYLKFTRRINWSEVFCHTKILIERDAHVSVIVAIFSNIYAYQNITLWLGYMLVVEYFSSIPSGLGLIPNDYQIFTNSSKIQNTEENLNILSAASVTVLHEGES